MKTKCLECGKKIVRYKRKSKIFPDMDIKVVNMFCDKYCEHEYYLKLYETIGYNDGVEDTFDVVFKELELNLKYQGRFEE